MDGPRDEAHAWAKGCADSGIPAIHVVAESHGAAVGTQIPQRHHAIRRGAQKDVVVRAVEGAEVRKCDGAEERKGVVALLPFTIPKFEPLNGDLSRATKALGAGRATQCAGFSWASRITRATDPLDASST
jgi:hypothetical protein